MLNRFGFRKAEITRFESMENYIADRTEQIDEYLELFGPFAEFKNKTVMEVGCSQGYLLNSFLDNVHFYPIGADLDADALDIARKNYGEKIRFVQTTASSIPVADESVDIIYSIDTVEHLSNIRAIFSECYRILKPGGTMFVHFQGWYGPYGSHLEDIIPFPWANAVFSMDTLLKVAAHLYDSPDYDVACYFVDPETGKRKPNPYLDRAGWDEFLNHLTIRQFKRVISELPFEVKHFENIGFGGRTFRIGRYLSKLSKVPVANEFFTKATFTVLGKP
ncbi:MAG TPA: class I SAM-dependent methyltransferase [Pyrinomonadaceae bacterium]|nr:class I SAM-dependent methyltransferase [Pyrinomonadaceae bacterium]